MDRAMKPGQGFAWRPLVRNGATIAGIEIWRKPGRPAVYSADAEYTLFIDGAGTGVTRLVRKVPAHAPTPKSVVWSGGARKEGLASCRPAGCSDECRFTRQRTKG